VNYCCTLGDYERAENYLDHINAMWDRVEDQEIKVKTLIHLGNFKRLIGDLHESLNHSRNALSIIGERDHIYRCEVLICLGLVLTVYGEFEQAEVAYQQAVTFATKKDKPRQAIEAQAGLARVYMALGETERALAQVKEVLAYMEANTPPKGSSFCLDGTEEPNRILLTCYQVLKANHDPRANAILTDAYNLLQKRAANISDEHLRHCFLNNVTVNREIVEEYEAMSLDGGVPK